VKDDRVPIAMAQQTAGLTQHETQALFRLIVKKSTPFPADTIHPAEAVLVLAAGLLKGYGFDSSSVLTLMARLWAWLEADEHQAVMLNVVDRRYVGWHCMGQGVLVDMLTGDDVPPERALPTVLESIAYNLYELLKRRTAMARGERSSLWEGRDAFSHTALGEAPEGVGGLGEPQVLRDDARAAVP
jgi:hypothetical protein